MCGLSHVGSVQAVVIGHVRVVVVFQGHHVGHERVGWDLERLQEVSLLGRRRTNGGRDKYVKQ